LAHFKLGPRNVVVNVATLVKLHQEKCHHEANCGPLETSGDCVKHPDLNLAREQPDSTLEDDPLARSNFLPRPKRSPYRLIGNQLRELRLRPKCGPLNSAVYGVGAGDSDSLAEGDAASEGDGDAMGSAAFLVAAFLGDAVGDGDASGACFFVVVAFSVVAVFFAVVLFFVVDAAVAVLDVVAVSCLWAQEMKDATTAMAVIKEKTDIFIKM